MLMRRTVSFAAIAAVLFAAPVLGQTTGAISPAITAEDFMARAAMGDRFEIESAKVVQSKSQAQATEEFARHLVDDHSTSSRALESLSRDVGVSPPNVVKLDAAHQAKIDSLRQAEGRQADELFARMQVAAHEDALALYRAYAEAGDNAALKQFARQTIPVLEQHLAMAKKLNGGQ
jgi:putative membrane protein